MRAFCMESKSIANAEVSSRTKHKFDLDILLEKKVGEGGSCEILCRFRNIEQP